MLDTHIHTALVVLETVVDPGSLFANRVLQWHIVFWVHCCFSHVVFMFQVSIFSIFERSMVLLDLFENYYLELYSFENRIVLIVTNLLNFQYSFQRKSKEKPHWAWRGERYFIIKSYHIVPIFRATVEVLQMTWQPCASLFSFFHILRFWEEHGTVKVDIKSLFGAAYSWI
mgnify:CR=1 FL=1